MSSLFKISDDFSSIIHKAKWMAWYHLGPAYHSSFNYSMSLTCLHHSGHSVLPFSLILPFFSKTSLHGLCFSLIQVSILPSSLQRGGPSDYIIYKSCIHVCILTRFYLCCPVLGLLYGILHYLALLFI